MSVRNQKQQGFSTVELLISLFIAAAFLVAGFQLFSVATKNSNEARLRAKAGSIASETIQARMYAANTPCSPTPAAATIAIPSSDLPQASAAVTYSCPYGNTSGTTRVSVVVTYGPSALKVEESLDVSG